MIRDLAIPHYLIIAAMALAGVGFGFGYFALLRRTATLATVGHGWVGPAVLTIGRVGLAVLFFGFAVRLGAAALLAGFAGFLVARWAAMRGARRAG